MATLTFSLTSLSFYKLTLLLLVNEVSSLQLNLTNSVILNFPLSQTSIIFFFFNMLLKSFTISTISNSNEAWGEAERHLRELEWGWKRSNGGGEGEGKISPFVPTPSCPLLLSQLGGKSTRSQANNSWTHGKMPATSNEDLNHLAPVSWEKSQK